MRKFLIVSLIVMLVLCFIETGAGSDSFFFSSWEKTSVSPAEWGKLVIVKNPDSNAEIKSVVIGVSPQDIVLMYWYFENGDSRFYCLTTGGYLRNPKMEKGCSKCHDKA
jgi:hypothetical protein